jgi:dihydrofolate reductase
MSTVFVHMGVSLDGFVAGTNRGPKNPMGGVAPTLHKWMFEQKAFRDHLGIPGEGKTGPDNDAAAHTFDRIGANIMGARMFEEGEVAWPEKAPFGNPVFVLTHKKREPWARPGGTTFYFVNDSLERVLAMAREAAGSKDVRISGGKDIVVQYLNAGLVEELCLDLTPVLIGEGLRLFDGIDRTKVNLTIAEATHSPVVTHLRYSVTKT